jgi:uncharacterized membrane protein YhaH (DUF805 family)
MGSSAVAALIFFVMAYGLGGQAANPVATMLAGSVGIGGYVAVAWIQLAVGVKRLHDQGRSGWFYLITLVPGIGSLILLVMLGFRDSAPGDNRFGGSNKYLHIDHSLAVFD